MRIDSLASPNIPSRRQQRGLLDERPVRTILQLPARLADPGRCFLPDLHHVAIVSIWLEPERTSDTTIGLMPLSMGLTARPMAASVSLTCHEHRSICAGKRCFSRNCVPYRADAKWHLRRDARCQPCNRLSKAREQDD
jgi:hypothetical protein